MWLLLFLRFYGFGETDASRSVISVLHFGSKFQKEK